MKTGRAAERKMAVAVVAPQYGLVGGAESYACHLSEQLSLQEDFAKDLIRSGTQGFVLGEHPSPMDIADRLAILLKKESRLTMGREARRTASDHGWEKKGRLHAEMYRSLSRRSPQEVPLAEWSPQTV